MEELWYEKEKEQNAMRGSLMAQEKRRNLYEQKEVTKRLDDFTVDTSVVGPWMFVSNIRNHKIVYKASSRVYDPTTQISTYKSGKAIQFEMGRFVTDDPKIVDFLISKRDFGSKFVAAFNVMAYKKARRYALGMEDEEIAEVAEVKEAEAKKIPEVPVKELSPEELAALNEDIGQGQIIDDDEDPMTTSSAAGSSAESFKEILSKPYKSSEDERFKELDNKIDKLASMMEVFMESSGSKGKPEEPKMYIENEAREKSYTCQRCGMDGFKSGNDVAQHRKVGECNAVLAKKLAQEAVAEAPQVHTGMHTAR